MSRIAPPFLHAQVASMACSRLQSRFLIVAGPNMGKSSILDRLEETERRCKRFDLTAEQDLPEPEELENAKCLLLDNVHKGRAWFLRILATLGPSTRIVATSEESFAHQDVSFPDRSCTILELNPWDQALSAARNTHAAAWGRAWTEARKALEKGYGRGAGDLPIEWIHHMFNLTSGHPMLVEVAFELNVLAYESYFAQELSPDEAAQRLAADEAFLKAQLVSRAEPIADAAVTWVLAQDPGLESVLAQSGEPDGLSISQEKTLRLAGLVFGSSDFLAWTANEVLRPLVLRTLSGVAKPTTRQVVVVRPDPGRSQEGTLEFYPGTEKHERVHLRGRGWMVLNALHEARGELVSIDKLLEMFPGVDSQQAVRSAVQRIADRLRDRNLPRVIENQHGRGYAFRQPTSPPS